MTAPITAVEDAPLSEKEQADFTRLTELLRLGFKTMEQMASALREIQQRKLYRGKFRTFETYVRTEWDMSIRRAYQLCEFGGVIENLRLHNCAQIPENEAQTRELAKAPADDQPKVWAQVIESGEKPTAKKIESVVVEVIKPRREKLTCQVDVIDVQEQEPTPTERAAAMVGVSVEVVEAGGRLKQSFPEQFEKVWKGKFTDAMIDLWNMGGKDERIDFLARVFGTRPRRDVQSAIRNAVKKSISAPAKPPSLSELWAEKEAGAARR